MSGISGFRSNQLLETFARIGERSEDKAKIDEKPEFMRYK